MSQDNNCFYLKMAVCLLSLALAGFFICGVILMISGWKGPLIFGVGLALCCKAIQVSFSEKNKVRKNSASFYMLLMGGLVSVQGWLHLDRSNILIYGGNTVAYTEAYLPFLLVSIVATAFGLCLFIYSKLKVVAAEKEGFFTSVQINAEQAIDHQRFQFVEEEINKLTHRYSRVKKYLICFFMVSFFCVLIQVLLALTAGSFRGPSNSIDHIDIPNELSMLVGKGRNDAYFMIKHNIEKSNYDAVLELIEQTNKLSEEKAKALTNYIFLQKIILNYDSSSNALPFDKRNNFTEEFNRFYSAYKRGVDFTVSPKVIYVLERIAFGRAESNVAKRYTQDELRKSFIFDVVDKLSWVVGLVSFITLILLFSVNLLIYQRLNRIKSYLR